MATLRDIARKAAVSTATVSNVLNDSLYVSPELRARVLAVAQKLNYRPNTVARSLRLKRSYTVGMIVPDVTDPFFPAVVRGAEDVLTRAGFTLIIGNSDNDLAKEEAYYRTFLDRQVDGLLTVPTSDDAPTILNRFQERGIAVVYVDRFHAHMPGDIVMADDLEGSRRCVRHLAASGRRRIATITGPLNLSNARARLEGYRRALKQAHLPVDERLICEGRFDAASGRERTRELLSRTPPPDALFVANALMACGALQAFEEAGLSCPGELALASFDRLDFFDLLRPRLTGVVVPPYDLGARGADLVLKRISGELTGRGGRHIVRTKLLRRESSARIPR
jgi:DNA-binding LacI/PurR family transcriptional regulator